MRRNGTDGYDRGERGTALVLVMGVLLVAGIFGIAFSFEDAVAHRAAAARLEEVRAFGKTPPAGRHAIPLSPDVRDSLPTARAEETVREREPGLFAMEVTVSWSGAGGEPRSVVLSTLIAAAGGDR